MHRTYASVPLFVTLESTFNAWSIYHLNCNLLHKHAHVLGCASRLADSECFACWPRGFQLPLRCNYAVYDFNIHIRGHTQATMRYNEYVLTT